MLSLIRLLIAAVAVVYLIVFAVQNRAAVDVVLWPGLVPITLPVWSLVMIAVVLGVVVSAITLWFSGLRWRARASAAQRKLHSQDRRREAGERREEQAAALRAAERRKAAEKEAGDRPVVGPALAAPARGTGSLAISSS